MDPILLADDGELDDVRGVLDELGLAFAHLRGGAVPDEVEAPARLFVATPRRAALADGWPDASAPSRVCLTTDDSNALREQLRTRGFRYLVRRPVHPWALRLILLQALYAGDEKRQEERVVVGEEVEIRVGTRVQRALLADLSTRGGRILTGTAIPDGSRLTLQVPPEIACGEPLSLRAKVVRCTADEDGHHDVALAVEEPSESIRERLEGTVTLLAERAPEKASLPQAAPASAADRRKYRRVQFEGEARPVGADAGSALLGRDLSMGGMRIEPRDDLVPGATLRLAIYAAPGEEAFEVNAEVVRREDEGMALRFTGVAPEVAQRIETLVAGLPGVETLDAGELGGLGAVISEILEREGGAED